MAKFNLKVFKKGSPWLWAGGAVILFIVFYLIASKRSPEESQGGYNVYNPGPSDAQVATAAQITMAQIAANAQTSQANAELAALNQQGQVALGIAQLENQLGVYAIEQQAQIDLLRAENDLSAELAYFDFQRDSIESQTQYFIDSAKIASSEAIAMREIDRAMFNDQLEASLSANLIGQVGTLKKKDRDETLQILAGNIQGYPVRYTNPSGPAQIYGY